jgi:hypothetical protein
MPLNPAKINMGDNSGAKAIRANFIVFDLTLQGLEPFIF